MLRCGPRREAGMPAPESTSECCPCSLSWATQADLQRAASLHSAAGLLRRAGADALRLREVRLRRVGLRWSDHRPDHRSAGHLDGAWAR